MSNFYEVVYALVRQVPKGKVTTYGAIAAMAGNPMASRAVGYALRALNPGTDVPWQRVINAQGKVSPRGIGEREPLLQRHLLEKEGVVFDAEDRVDLRKYGWEGIDSN